MVVMSIAIYVLFLIIQNWRHREYFVRPVAGQASLRLRGIMEKQIPSLDHRDIAGHVLAAGRIFGGRNRPPLSITRLRSFMRQQPWVAFWWRP